MQSLLTYSYCCVTLTGVFLDLEETECAALNTVCAVLYGASLLTVSVCKKSSPSSCKLTLHAPLFLC